MELKCLEKFQIEVKLERIYCNSIGIEYMYIRTPERIQWIQEKLNHNSNSPDFSNNQKKQILKKTIEAVVFEKFLHTKYVGQKRFSLEGGEALIPVAKLKTPLLFPVNLEIGLF